VNVSTDHMRAAVCMREEEGSGELLGSWLLYMGLLRQRIHWDWSFGLGRSRRIRIEDRQQGEEVR
jgi:hypothetical protein